jgi:hypothetical protein
MRPLGGFPSVINSPVDPSAGISSVINSPVDPSAGFPSVTVKEKLTKNS